MHNKTDSNQVQKLFLSALEIPEDQRDAWLTEQCGEDKQLLAEVRSLLQHDALTKDPLEQGLHPTVFSGAGLEHRDQAGLHVRCPHCHNPIELVDDDYLNDIVCSSCGSSFSLIGVEETKSYRATNQAGIGHFQLLDKVGFGAFGTVYKARDTTLDRIVAIKIPRKGQISEEEADRFLREARTAAQLQHPNIVSVYEVGREDDRVYIVSDFVDGLTLSDWLTGMQLTPSEAAKLCVKLANALHHAHQQGVIHRDLKPSNIMLDRRNEPYLMDFGLAKREVGEITVTMDGQVLGTPAYMSPEQARGEGHHVDRRTDIYALGVILFEMLTRELPFRGNTQMLMHQVLTEEPPSPRRYNASIPKDLETITLKCLQKEPGQRYQTAQDFADDVTRFISGEPILARPIGRLERGWRWCKRHRTVAVLATSVLLALAGGAGVSTYYALEAGARAEDAERERARAVEAFRKARQAVDDSFTLVSQNQLINEPGMQPLRKELLQRSLQYYEGFADELADDPSLQVDLAAAYRRAGNIRRVLGELVAAEVAYTKAIEIGATLADQDSTASQYQSDLAEAHHGLANVLSTTGKESAALAHYNTAIEINQELVARDPDVPDHQSDLAGDYLGLAKLQRDMGLLSAAVISTQQALEIDEQLVEQYPQVQLYQSELADGYTLRGFLHVPTLPGEYLQRHQDEAIKAAGLAYARAVEIQNTLAKENPAVMQYQSDLANSYANLGDLQRIADRFDEAESSYSKAVKIQEKLERENPTVLQYKSDLAQSYTNLGNLVRVAKRLDEAEGYYRQAVDIQKGLAWENPAVPDYQIGLAWAYNNLAAVQHLAGRDDSAEQILRQAIKGWENSALSAADVPLRERALAVLYAQLAKQISLSGGDPASALAAMKQAFSLAPKSDWVRAACGDAAALSRDWKQAAKQYAMADELNGHGWHMMFIHAVLELAAGNDAAYRDLCRDFVKRHSQNEKQNVMLAIVLACAMGEDAVDDWDLVLETARKTVDADRQSPLPKIGLGATLFHAGRFKDAEVVLAGAVPLHLFAIRQRPDLKQALQQSQLMGLTYLALIYRDQGKHELSKSARDNAEMIIANLEQSAPGFDEGLALWAGRFAAHISRRKFARFLDSPSE